jgi:hypothetical protein
MVPLNLMSTVPPGWVAVAGPKVTASKAVADVVDGEELSEQAMASAEAKAMAAESGTDRDMGGPFLVLRDSCTAS